MQDYKIDAAIVLDKVLFRDLAIIAIRLGRDGVKVMQAWASIDPPTKVGEDQFVLP
ncbi:MAG: hypothetical protein AAF231_11795 [Pseudomonadota bacterium]